MSIPLIALPVGDPARCARCGDLRPRANLTLVGCLYHEKSGPGRTPNVAEKAGVLEDYILADASMPADATKNTTLATGNMYKVEHIADEKLRG